MNSKQYAKERKLTLKQFNDLAKLILGTVSASLHEEQIASLDGRAIFFGGDGTGNAVR